MKKILNEWRQYLNEAQGPMGQTGMHEPTTPEEAAKTTAPEDAVDLYRIAYAKESGEWGRVEPLLKAFMEKKASNLPHREQCFDYGDSCVDIEPVYNAQTEPKKPTDKNLWQLEGWGSEFVDEGIKDGSLKCPESEGCEAEDIESAKRFFGMLDGAPLDARTNLVFGLWEKVAGPKPEPEAEPAAPAAEPEEKSKPKPSRWATKTLGRGLDWAEEKGIPGLSAMNRWTRSEPIFEENRKLTKAGLKQLIREELSKELNK